MPAKKQKVSPETNGNLEQAMALLIQNQAAFMSAFIAQLSRTEARFDNIERLLAEHHRILVELPEAIREKIGFKARG